MNLLPVIKLARSRINRLSLSEAKKCAWQALLGLKDVVGESLLKLLFRWIVTELIRGVLNYLFTEFMK
jgi:hypothetical protein